MKTPTPPPRTLGPLLILAFGLTLAACGGGGGPEGPGGGTGGAPDRGALRLTASPAAGTVVYNVLEHGDRYEMSSDPVANEAQARDMLAVMQGTWRYGSVLYEFGNDGYWRRVDDDPFGTIGVYTIGLYYRPGSTTPLWAASVRMQFDPQFLVVAPGNTLAIGNEDTYGDTYTEIHQRYE